MMALNFYRVRDYSFPLQILVKAVNISLHYNESETHQEWIDKGSLSPRSKNLHSSS